MLDKLLRILKAMKELSNKNKKQEINKTESSNKRMKNTQKQLLLLMKPKSLSNT
jgi:hypothetical protein